MTKWECPQCGIRLEFPNETARNLAERARACAGCRMRETLMTDSAKPITAAVLDFFSRKGGPASDTWKELVPFDLLQAFNLAHHSDTELLRLFGVAVKVGE